VQSIAQKLGAALKELQRTFQGCFTFLKFSGVDIENWDPILVYMCSTKLPKLTLSLWEQSIKKKAEIPTWLKLDSYLTERHRTPEAVDSFRSANLHLQRHKTSTAESLKKAFKERIIARYWVPKIVITDNGVQFTSKTFKSFLAEMGAKQQFTAPYTPQENPTERANRTVKTMIAQFAGQNQRDWDEKWPEIMLAVNTSDTPSFITQGREPRLPSALYDR